MKVIEYLNERISVEAYDYLVSSVNNDNTFVCDFLLGFYEINGKKDLLELFIKFIDSSVDLLKSPPEGLKSAISLWNASPSLDADQRHSLIKVGLAS